MKNQEAVIVGCVMLWQSHSTPTCRESFTSSPQFVTEFCSTSVRDGVINMSPRMKELALAGFAPVAVVSMDGDAFYIFARNGTSDEIQSQLLADSEAILGAAAKAVGHPVHASCPHPERSAQSKTTEVLYE